MKTTRRVRSVANKSDNRLDNVIKLKFEADKLPELPDNERVKLEHAIALDHLYHSSALEGSRLNAEQIRSAVNG